MVDFLQDFPRILEIRVRVLDPFGLLDVIFSPFYVQPRLFRLERLRLLFPIPQDPLHFHIWGSHPQNSFPTSSLWEIRDGLRGGASRMLLFL